MALPLGTAVVLTSKKPEDQVYQNLIVCGDEWEDAGVKSVSRIGDCEAPSVFAAAVHAGHRWARDLDSSERPVPKILPMPLR